tara:strand:- start:553 stop:672 length:120 start_codon:yes stop_codon:yes gene_type:complete
MTDDFIFCGRVVSANYFHLLIQTIASPVGEGGDLIDLYF